MDKAYATFVQHLTSFKSHCKRAADLDYSQLSQGLITGRLKLVDSIFQKISDASDEYRILAYGTDIKPDTTEKDQLDRVIKYTAESEDAYLKIIEKLNNAFQASSLKQNPNPSSSSNSWKTPALDCEDFFGDYTSWPSFRDSFSSTFIKNPNLSNVQKLQHLRRKCKNDAYNLVSQFQLEDIFFEDAWKALASEYENKRFLVNAHLKKIFSLQSCLSESASGIKTLYDTVNNCLSALKNYDVQTANWDPILVYLIGSKLPHETLGLWEQQLNKPQEIPSWALFNEFLHSRFRQLSAIADAKNFKSNSTSNKLQTSVASSNRNLNSFHTQNSRSIICKLCQQNHQLFHCSQYHQKDAKSRYNFAKDNQLCINCLGSNHQTKDCPSKRFCSKCKKRHHTLLHFSSSITHSNAAIATPSASSPSTSNLFASDNNVNQNDSAINSSSNVQNSSVHGYFAKNNTKILLATAILKVSQNNHSSFVRALIDPGSDATFILESTVNQLKWTTTPCTANVIGMGSVQTATSSKLCSYMLHSRFDKTLKISATAVVMKKLTGHLPIESIDISQISELTKLPLADPEFHKSGKIDMVIGADLYSSIIQEGIHKASTSSPLAQNTIFGWILSGPCRNVSSFHTNTVVSFFNEVQLNKEIEKFWEQEEIPAEKYVSPEDLYCEKLYQQTTTRNSDGKYIVRLPFKPGFPDDVFLGKSRAIALRQFLRTENTLYKKPSLKTVYDEVMMEYLSLNHMKQAEYFEKLQYNNSISESIQTFKAYSCYLPHHGVAKPDSVSTKWRIVYNASSPTTNGISLNDSLCTGPALQQDLVLILLRWRRYPYIFTADIQKMYRQIWIHPNDADYQRILYRTCISDEIQDFKLLTVTFGVNCAPYLAIRTLLRLAEDEGNKFPIAANIVRNDFYVDDVLSGGFDLEEVKSAQQELNLLLQSGGFPLKKWAANHPDLLQHIPIEDQLKENLLSFSESSTIKALGIYWDSKNDTFTFKFKNFENSAPFTKRKLFSNIAKLFDPAGWLAPVVVTAKIMMQNIWSDKTDWDEEVKLTRATEWSQFYKDLPAIEKINISRWLSYRPNCKIQYHGFCDASQKAFAAAMYMRVEDEQGNVTVNLISAKTKVAPLKVISIPRLELCGAVLLAKLAKYLMNGLNCTAYEYVMWTDSTVVLSWLKHSPSRWKTFIANRVTKVLNHVKSSQWRHIPTNLNPADLATRGVEPSELISNSLWWHGPSFLKNSQTCWPETEYTTPEFGLEERKQINSFNTEVRVTLDPLKNYSSYEKALRVYAYIFRFFNRTNPKNNNPFRCRILVISTEEINFVKNRLIRVTQTIYYPLEYTILQEKKILPSKSSLLSFNPFLDTDGVMRSNGRLAQSNLSFNEKFPILLPYASHFTKLLIKFIHKITIHGGNKLILNILRKEFWIPRVRNLIKSLNSQCKICFLWRARTQDQIMSALPLNRVVLETPFAFRNCVGVDYAGPIQLKPKKGRFNINSTTKGYICLFICFSTKAVHLEAVSDLSTEAYLAAFDRFVSRRGLCKTLISDNGTNFIGASRELKRQMKAAITNATSETSTFYAARGIKWHFIPPGTPHYGGLWEAGVKSMKHHLRRAMHNNHYTFEELCTILTKIEACLNSRPLTPISEDPLEVDYLTPGHFLIGNALLATPHEDLVDVNINSLKRWKQLEAVQQSICRRWKEEYICQLHQRPKWRTPKQTVKVGDLVVVRQEKIPPTEWRLGRVISTHPGSDGQIRIATLKTKHGHMIRHINKLCILPIENSVTALCTNTILH